MALFSWFDTGEVDDFARSIAGELVKRAPPASLEGADEKAAKRLARAETFARTHKLNVYKKARLGNQFRWALREAGYPVKFIESWTYELVTLITVKSTARK
jgi:hypothetical protein